MAAGADSGSVRDGAGTMSEVDVETARMWRRAPRPFVLFVTLFFAVWTVRATVLYGIDTHIAPDLARRLYDYALKVTLWVVPVIVYLCRVERVPPWRALRLTPPVSRSGLAKAGAAAALYFGVVLLYAMVRGRDLAAFLHANLPLALASVAFSPVCEEILFRGFILGRLWASLGFWRANLLTALLFTLVHWPNWVWVHGWPFALASSVSVYVVGVFLGMLVKLTDSLWPSLGAHIAYNVLITVLGPF